MVFKTNILDLNSNYSNARQLARRKSNTKLEIPDEVRQLNFETERKYWRRNLKFTLCPLLLCGIPIYLFFISDKPRDYVNKRRATSFQQWMSFILRTSRHSPVIAVVNMFYLVIAFCVNLIFLLSIWTAFYALIVLGEFQHRALLSIIDALRRILVLVAVNGIWIYGYRLRSFVSDLDTFQPPLPLPFKPLPFTRLRLGLLYALIAAIHVLHGFMFFTQRVPGRDVEDWYYVKSWLKYVQNPLLASIYFPIYANLAWTLRRHCIVLRLYLSTSTSSSEIEHSPDHVLPAFKHCFKELSTAFQGLTAMFGAYFSWAIVVLLISMSEEMADFGYLILNTTSGISETDISVFWTPIRVRAFMTLLLVVSLKIGLVVYIVGVGRTTNGEIKYLLVALNDFMASTAKDLPMETYQKFRLLKYYVESRLETGAKASLLQLPATQALSQMSRSNLNTFLIAFTQFSLLLTVTLQSENGDGNSGFFNALISRATHAGAKLINISSE